MKLTADICRLSESFEYLRIHSDDSVLLFDFLGIASLNKIIDEACEFFSEDGVEHIDEPSSWQNISVLFIRHIFVDLLMVPSKLPHLFNIDAFIIGSFEHSDVRCLDV